MRRGAGIAAVALAALLCMGTAASDPAERLHDPAEEARARALFTQFRCVQCQNQSIDESDAPIADDLRRIIRQQIVAGRSNGQIRGFMVQRYGEFILMKPRFSPANALLWLTPFVIVGAGVTVIALRRRDPALEPPLSASERQRLAELAPPNPEPTGEAAATVPPQDGAMDGRGA